MKLLLDTRNEIIEIADSMTKETQDERVFWVFGNTRFLDNNYHLEVVSNVPIDVVPHKYFYIDGQFVLNPNWINTPEEFNNVNKKIDGLVLTKAESELEIEERISKLELGLA